MKKIHKLNLQKYRGFAICDYYWRNKKYSVRKFNKIDINKFDQYMNAKQIKITSQDRYCFPKAKVNNYLFEICAVSKTYICNLAFRKSLHSGNLEMSFKVFEYIGNSDYKMLKFEEQNKVGKVIINKHFKEYQKWLLQHS